MYIWCKNKVEFTDFKRLLNSRSPTKCWIGNHIRTYLGNFFHLCHLKANPGSLGSDLLLQVLSPVRSNNPLNNRRRSRPNFSDLSLSNRAARLFYSKINLELTTWELEVNPPRFLISPPPPYGGPCPGALFIQLLGSILFCEQDLSDVEIMNMLYIKSWNLLVQTFEKNHNVKTNSSKFSQAMDSRIILASRCYRLAALIFVSINRTAR